MIQILFSLCMLFAHAAEAPSSSSYDWELSTDPVQWLIGPNARIEYRIGEHWTLGPAFTAQNRAIRAVQVKTFAPGIYLSYAFSQALQQSWFIDVGAFYGVVHASYVDDQGTTDRLNIGNWTERLIVGHQWNFGHFTINVGAGEEFNSAGNAQIYASDGRDVATLWLYPARFVVDFSLGIVF